MQNANIDNYLDELITESRLPVSTLRSTASPYKRGRISVSVGNYGEYLASLKLNKFQDVSKLSVAQKSSGTSPSSTSATSLRSIAFPNHASDASILSLQEEESIYSLDPTSCDDEDASKAHSTAPSTPFTVPSSPLSTGADISTALDPLEDEDEETESDRALSPSCRSKPLPLSTSPVELPPVASSTPDLRIAITAPEITELNASSKPSQSLLKTHNPPRKLVSLEQTTKDRNHRKRRRSPSLTRRSRIRSLDHQELLIYAKEETVPKGKGMKTKSKSSISSNTRNVCHGLVGPLVQALVLSRKSSLPASAIVNDVLDSDPSLKPQRTIEEWTSLIVLTMGTYAMFGKAERKGLKNADDESVEDEWYYIPENDSDEERRETLRVFQRGEGKRRATLQKKQYYWKPIK
ncbi:hypothetical protein FRC17_008530 [Serendipita sp. 399]|nr:hypothetical protein FRC17_008530 [Serendipita sp. 399]